MAKLNPRIVRYDICLVINNRGCEENPSLKKQILTWIGDGDKARVSEVAVPVVTPIELVVGVEGVGGVRRESVGFIARVPHLDRNAIRTTFPAGVIQRVHHVRQRSSRLRHTPSLPDGLGLVRSRRRRRRRRRR